MPFEALQCLLVHLCYIVCDSSVQWEFFTYENCAIAVKSWETLI